jgi:alpha-glucosidase (family GH31 glycosyl hydrolase)
MYEETTHIVRDIIKRRYELIPYLYSLALESHSTATPPQRWTGWGYESDPEIWNNKVLTDGETQYWLGDSLLIGGVFEPGQSTAKMYLPRGDSDSSLHFLDVNEPQNYYKAGQWIEVSAKWDESIPVIAKVGSAIPVGRPEQTLSAGDITNPANLPLDDYRAVELFPPKSSSDGRKFGNTWYEDDGISPPPARISKFEVMYATDEKKIYVEYKEHLQTGFNPAWKKLHVVLPAGDRRSVVFNGQEVDVSKTDGKGRPHFEGKGVRSQI